MKKTITIQRTLELIIPSIPNFILISSDRLYSKTDGPPDEMKIPIDELTSEQVEAIIQAWATEFRTAATTRSRQATSLIRGIIEEAMIK